MNNSCSVNVGRLAAGAISFAAICFAQNPLTTVTGTRFDDRTNLFRYDQRVDLGVREVGTEKRGNVVIRDLTFSPTPARKAVKAYIAGPASDESCAGILWVHWLGDEKSNRTQFLDEAIELVPKGVVSLLVDAMWSDSGWYQKRIPEEDFENSIRQVVELRRAMDLLLSQPNVDKFRIGFVGHDYGGMYGTLMAGADRRAKTYVFIAVTPSLNDWAFFAAQPRSKVEYLRQNSVLELTDYVHEVKNASVLFQFGKSDFYVSGAGAAIYFRSANQPKVRKVYDAEHKMDRAEIRTDRDAWLIKELSLKK